MILPIEHGVKCGYFIDTHWRHFQEICNVVHNANARPSFILALTEIKKRNNCSFLILRRIVRNNILCTLQISNVKSEGNLNG
jgi:hypothetical protein